MSDWAISAANSVRQKVAESMNHIVAEQTSEEEEGNRKKERHKVVKEPQQGQQLLLSLLPVNGELR